MTNTAIVGIGKWGKNLVRVFDKTSNLKYAVSNGDTKNRNWLRENYPNIAYVGRIDKVLNDAEIDSVIVATPIDTHYNVCLKVINSGKNIFVEKPLTGNYRQSRRLVDLANKKSVKLFTGYIYLYNPVMQHLEKEIVESEIEFIDFKWSKYGSFNNSIIDNLLSHDISILKHLSKTDIDIENVQMSGSDVNSDTIQLSVLNSKDKFISKISIDRNSKVKSKQIKINTSGGTYLWIDNKLSYSSDELSYKEISLDSSTDTLERECLAFINYIDSNIQPKSGAEFSLEVDKILSNIKAIS